MSPDFDTLHQLYVVERLNVRDIAKRLGFASKTSVQNRLKAFGITARDAHNGLLNRGIEPPSREVLQHLIHVEHKGYREIAKIYDVDFTAIPYWLKKHQ